MYAGGAISVRVHATQWEKIEASHIPVFTRRSHLLPSRSVWNITVCKHSRDGPYLIIFVISQDFEMVLCCFYFSCHLLRKIGESAPRKTSLQYIYMTMSYSDHLHVEWVGIWMSNDDKCTSKMCKNKMIRQSELNLHVFLSNNTEGRENFDNLSHHVGLFGVNRSCQQQQTALISQDPLQSILWDI